MSKTAQRAVIPAQAGIHCCAANRVPAFAGMTIYLVPAAQWTPSFDGVTKNWRFSFMLFIQNNHHNP
jgi:hypothetical protein